MLRVSSGFSWVNSGERVWGSDSPVSEELSTWHGQRWVPGGAGHPASVSPSVPMPALGSP